MLLIFPLPTGGGGSGWGGIAGQASSVSASRIAKRLIGPPFGEGPFRFLCHPATRKRFVVAIRRARETGFSRLRTDPDSCMNTGTMTRLRQRPKEPGVCKGKKMKRHCHEFVDNYQGLVGFGMDHETDGNTVRYYLQKFSDDQLMNHLIPRMSHEELEEIFVLINRILRNHLTEGEYHCLFLKDDHPHG